MGGDCGAGRDTTTSQGPCRVFISAMVTCSAWPPVGQMHFQFQVGSDDTLDCISQTFFFLFRPSEHHPVEHDPVHCITKLNELASITALQCTMDYVDVW